MNIQIYLEAMINTQGKVLLFRSKLILFSFKSNDFDLVFYNWWISALTLGSKFHKERMNSSIINNMNTKIIVFKAYGRKVNFDRKQIELKI